MMGRVAAALAVAFLVMFQLVGANIVFKVQNKFAGKEIDLSAFKSHDSHRHARYLSAIDLPLGGDSQAAKAGLYFTEIGLGTPTQTFYVQVDTGSDILWVNCVGCANCPKKTDLGIELQLYNDKSSSTSKRVTCDDEFCSFISQGAKCESGAACEYSVLYGDGSSTNGYFVQDTIELKQVTGNLQTQPTTGTVTFGCGSKQSGQLGGSESAVDGIIGFGQSNSSVISQLAAEGKVRRSFAHCLDNANGGGIFAIGEVVSPKVKTTPMVPNQPHYNVVLKSIDVAGEALDLPSDIFASGNGGGTIVDSGTTLAYLPEIVYESLMSKLLAKHPGIRLHTVQESFKCFKYADSMDDAFPIVNFQFDGDLTLTVYPHDYLFQITVPHQGDLWCFGWQNGGMQTKDGSELTLLGDLTLNSKLVVYDIENQTVGWTDYNCSSSIKVKDQASGSVFELGAHDISYSSNLVIGFLLTFSSILLSVICVL